MESNLVSVEIDGIMTNISQAVLNKLKTATPAHIDGLMLDNIIETNKIIVMAAINDFFILKDGSPLDFRKDYEVTVRNNIVRQTPDDLNRCYFADRVVNIIVQNIKDKRVLQITIKSSENFYHLKMYTNVLLGEDKVIKDTFAPEMAAFPDAGLIQNTLLLGKIYDFLVFGDLDGNSPATKLIFH